jgi:hypothetical protein
MQISSESVGWFGSGQNILQATTGRIRISADRVRKNWPGVNSALVHKTWSHNSRTITEHIQVQLLLKSSPFAVVDCNQIMLGSKRFVWVRVMTIHVTFNTPHILYIPVSRHIKYNRLSIFHTYCMANSCRSMWHATSKMLQCLNLTCKIASSTNAFGRMWRMTTSYDALFIRH